MTTVFLTCKVYLLRLMYNLPVKVASQIFLSFERDNIDGHHANQLCKYLHFI